MKQWKRAGSLLAALCLLWTLGIGSSEALAAEVPADPFIPSVAVPSVSRTVEGPMLVAHRGLSSEAPENTLPAYSLAADRGFRYVETDIRPTKDGVWVLSHDNNLFRMTGYNGKISEMTLAQVQSHPIRKGANVKNYPGLTVPTLSDFLTLCEERNLSPVIELKTRGSNYPYSEVVEQIRTHHLEDRAIIISFYDTSLKAFRALAPEMAMQYIIVSPTKRAVGTAEAIGNCGLDIMSSQFQSDTSVLEDAKRRGIPLNVWTVDRMADAEAMLAAGTQFLTTNKILPGQIVVQ